MLIVAICTCARASLRETLRSVITQTCAPDHLIVIDNDHVPSAADIVAAEGPQAQAAGIALVHLHVPGRNVAQARNAALAAARALDPDARLAFIDDDETAEPEWLAELSAAMPDDAPGAIAAVFGPSRAVYPPNAPVWMQRLSPHSQSTPARGGEIRTGHTANCLVALGHPAMRRAEFDETLGPLGGSDTAFFAAAHGRGARFAVAPAAWVDEPVSPDRMSLSWLLRRRFRFGAAYAGIDPRSRLILGGLAGFKALACAGMYVVSLPAPVARNRALLRGALHAGVLAACVGWRRARWYH